MFRYIKARFWQFVGIIAFIIVSTAIISGGNVIDQMLIDAAMEGNLQGMQRCTLLMLGYSFFSVAIYVVCSVCQHVFEAALMNDVRLSVFDGILRRSRKDFEEHHSADYVSALTNDISTVQGQFLGMFFLLLMGIVNMVCSAALMLYYQPLVAICAIPCAFLMAGVPSVLGRLIGKWQKLRSKRLSALTALLTECFSGFETILTFGIQKAIRRRFFECSKALRDCEYRTQGFSALSDSLSQLFSCLVQAAILALSCFMVFTGRMSVGALVVFVSISSSFCSNLSTYLKIMSILKGVKPVIDRINTYADYADAKTQGDTEPTFFQSVAVKGLGFGYNADAPVLKNLSLTLQKGKKYALIGESGSGKSTLIRLLLGDYFDYTGSICYDGTELKELRRDKLNQVVACIHQDVFLFDDTIRNNICLFDEFDEGQFEWALKTSGVLKFAKTFPEGSSYMVGERGERLSGGQKQRIAIARALIRNTDFLILDEGTSALDEQTAVEIESELLKLPGLTLLTITHHLKKPQEYDQVFALREGRIGT